MNRARRTQVQLASIAAQIAAIASTDDRTETVSEVVALFTASRGERDAESTRNNRAYRLGQFSEVFGEIRFSEIGRDELGMFYAGFPFASQKNVRTTVEPMFTWAAANGWPGAQDAVPDRPRGMDISRDRWLTEEELGLVMRRLDWYERQPKSRQATVDALRLCPTTGLRSGEVVAVRAHEVAPDGSYLFLRETKVGPRKVPLGPVAKSIFLRRRSSCACPKGFLFPGRGGKPHMRQSSLSHAWRRLVAPLDLQNVRLHDARHTWASIALKHGEKLEVIQKALGHTTKHMTLRYAHIADLDFAEMAVRVEERITGTARVQLELGMEDWGIARAVKKFSPAKTRLMETEGARVYPQGAGQAQAAAALCRHGMLRKHRTGVYAITPKGREAQRYIHAS